MEIYIILLLVVILLETTYTTYHTISEHKKAAKHLTFIDSSVLIDGRIISIARSGFIPEGFVIPRSVIGELQFLADNADHEKRMRARHGLDVAHQLRSLETVEIGLFQDGVKADEGVDNRLLELAKKHGGAICTIDYNLNKVARVEGITVLNVNELNKELRSAYLPGEQADISLTQKGQDNSQGVGYLQDGTMVVVDNAAKFIGKTVTVEFTRLLQTDAGRMMFARLAKKEVPKKDRQSSAGRRQANQPATPAHNRKVTPSKTKKSSPKRSRMSEEDKLLHLIDKQS